MTIEFSSIPEFGDDPERLLAARHALEIVERVAPALPVIVPGRTGAVRGEDAFKAIGKPAGAGDKTLQFRSRMGFATDRDHGGIGKFSCFLCVLRALW